VGPEVKHGPEGWGRSTGKSFTVDGLREKLREFYREEGRNAGLAALSNVELITALLSSNR
jgi:hypothetical protein